VHTRSPSDRKDISLALARGVHYVWGMTKQPPALPVIAPDEYLFPTVQQRADLLDWMQYRRTVYLWPDSSMGHVAISERLNNYTVEHATKRPSAEFAQKVLHPQTYPAGSGCRGRRYYWVYDTDYPCNGCPDCHNWCAGFHIGAFVWAAAVGGEHREIAGAVAAYQCLAAVGAVFARLQECLARIGRFFERAEQRWEELRKGCLYRVQGRRGNAKNHNGAVGECCWIGQDDWGRPRAGLRFPGQEKLAYFGTGSLVRVPTPPHVLAQQELDARERAAAKLAQQAAKEKLAAAPRYSGGRDGTAYVLRGEHRGQFGKVFWIGEDKRRGGVRLGIRPGVVKGTRGAGKRQSNVEPIWANAADCCDQNDEVGMVAWDALQRGDEAALNEVLEARV